MDLRPKVPKKTEQSDVFQEILNALADMLAMPSLATGLNPDQIKTLYSVLEAMSYMRTRMMASDERARQLFEELQADRDQIKRLEAHGDKLLEDMTIKSAEIATFERILHQIKEII